MANQFTLKNGGYEPFIGNYGLVPQPPIPEPDAEDNGKVLGVSDGAYALVNGGGGGGGMTIIEGTTDSQTGAMSLDMTAKELYDLFKTGDTIMVRDISTEGLELYAKIVTAMYTEAGYVFSILVNSTGFAFSALEDDDYPNSQDK